MAKFYTYYNRPSCVVSPAGGTSLTDKSCLKDTDINVIIKRYAAGDNSSVRSAGVFADVSMLGDFASSLEVIRKATADFAALPAEVRDRFGNDPAALVKFLGDSSNDEEAIRLGLKVPRVVQKSLADEIVDGVTRAVKPPATAV